jgi:hypothetical protein
MKKLLALITAFVITSGYQTLSGDWAYSVSDNQATITGYSGDDTEVVIPSRVFVIEVEVAVVKVGDEAFKDNTSVTSITIPDSVTSIGDAAFANCTSYLNCFLKSPLLDLEQDSDRF